MSFLGVTRSLTGRCWSGPDAETCRRAEALARAGGLGDALARVLARRGVGSDGLADYLAPTLRALLPDPAGLRDMTRAAARLCTAVGRKQRIAVFADYDVDGGASAALLIGWLRDLGREATLYIPDRLSEGYGPNAPAMARLAGTHDLILCVDCGTLAHEALAAAEAADVIVLDHHLGGETLPPAHAVVNPNRQDEDGALGHLCAAAVVFLLLVEATRQRRAAGLAGPDLTAMLDLVALATVADVAPLVGVNRAFVRQGLRVMARGARPGLAALAGAAGLAGAPAAHHLGFVLGPRINAGGRIGRADLGARLMATPDPAEAAALAARLEALNGERRAVEAAVRAGAERAAGALGPEAPLVWAAAPGWHPGVVGIVAARLVEAYGRPAVVLGVEDGVARGSGRSLPGVDLGRAVQRLATEGLIEKGGGHEMAAGLTLPEAQLGPAMARLGELLAGGTPRAATFALDGTLLPAAATGALLDDLERAGPFGAGAPAPRFAFPDLAITHVRRVGADHLRISARAEDGARLEAIGFGMAAGPVGAALAGNRGARFHLAGRLVADRWRGGGQVELRLEDAAHADGRG